MNYYIYIGGYRLTLPENSHVDVEITDRVSDLSEQVLYTYWKINLGKFYFSIHLSPNSELSGLKNFIDFTTKQNVFVKDIVVNNIPGVTHGGYDEPRTWIDWWFRKNDITLCLNLQSKKFPHTVPKENDILLHENIINSLQYLA